MLQQHSRKIGHALQHTAPKWDDWIGLRFSTLAQWGAYSNDHPAWSTSCSCCLRSCSICRTLELLVADQSVENVLAALFALFLYHSYCPFSSMTLYTESFISPMLSWLLGHFLWFSPSLQWAVDIELSALVSAILVILALIFALSCSLCLSPTLSCSL